MYVTYHLKWPLLKHSKSSLRSWDCLRKLRGTLYFTLHLPSVSLWLVTPFTETRRSLPSFIYIYQRRSIMINSRSIKIPTCFEFFIASICAPLRPIFMKITFKSASQFNISMTKICISNDCGDGMYVELELCKRKHSIVHVFIFRRL